MTCEFGNLTVENVMQQRTAYWIVKRCYWQDIPMHLSAYSLACVEICQAGCRRVRDHFHSGRSMALLKLFGTWLSAHTTPYRTVKG